MNLIVDKLIQMCNHYNSEIKFLRTEFHDKIKVLETRLAETELQLEQERQTGYVLIGYADTNEPVFIHRNCSYDQLCIILTQELQRGRFLVDSVKQLRHIKKIDFKDMFYTSGPSAYFENDYVWTDIIKDTRALNIPKSLVLAFEKNGVQLLLDDKPPV